ncbi:MAG: hypothetical protein Q8N62_06460 [Candidatus Omnitrophota bacterium]|nr:hypothetical protein [Candidatus Omnitrophota bacterium]
MKKVLLVLFAVAFVTSMCFAEEASVLDSEHNSTDSAQASSNVAAPAQVPSTTVASTQLPANTTSTASAGTAIFTGKVDFVSSGSGISGVNPQITVKDDKGQGTIFMVASDATIIDKDGNSTTLTWIGKDDKVNIEYITNQDGIKTAKSIKVSAD